MTTDKPDPTPAAPAYAPPPPGGAAAAAPPAGQQGPWQQGPPPRPRSRVLPNVLLSVLALLLAPLAYALLAYGAGERYTMTMIRLDGGSETVLPTLLMLLGLFLFLVVGALGAWAPLAPVLAGIVVGILPGVYNLIDPVGSVRPLYDLLGARFANPVSTLSGLGVPLLVGVLLLTCGVACALARRSGARAARLG